MKKLLFLPILCAFLSVFAQNYNSNNVKLLGTWDSMTEVPATNSGIGNRYASCWGYAQKGREYAIVGAHNGTFIFDVTNPESPVKKAFVKGRRSNCVWREYKTYQNYLYCISDDGSPNSFQIVDLSYLPDSVKVVHDDETIFRQGHTIWVDRNKMYIASTKFQNSFSPMSVFDLTNPAKPTLIRNLSDDIPNAPTAHDMFVRNDTCYMSGGNSGLKIYKLGADKKFTELGSLTQYPGSGYNHTSMLLPDSKHMVMLDEVPNSLPVKVINVKDLSDIKTVHTFTGGSKATPHNPFPAPNNRVVISYYEDGVQIFDMTNPLKPIKTGFFDTHYQTDSTATTGGYKGAWSAYTELPSKNMIVVDMQNGLFVLDPKKAYGITTSSQDVVNQSFGTIYPNPFTDEIKINSAENGSFDVTIFDMTGKKIFFEKNANIAQKSISTTTFPKGVYVVLIANDKKMFSQKMVK